MHVTPETPPIQHEAVVSIHEGIASVAVPVDSDRIKRDEAIHIGSQVMSEDDPTLSDLGVRYSIDPSGDIELQVPRAKKLNSRLEEQGITDRKYGDFEGGFIPLSTHAESMKDGILLIASEAGFIIHDASYHMANFAKLPPRAIRIFKRTASEAVQTGDPIQIEDAVNMVEINTNKDITAENLAQLYKTRMRPMTAAILARKDVRTVQKRMRQKRKSSDTQPQSSPTIPVMGR